LLVGGKEQLRLWVRPNGLHKINMTVQIFGTFADKREETQAYIGSLERGVHKREKALGD
jgi:hypothetical protein